MTWLWLLLLSVASGLLYRAGGCSPEDLKEEFGWMPEPFRSFPKKRDVGCNVLSITAALLVGCTGPWWAWLLVFGLTWASLSTYWDFLFGFDNHWMHGWVIGMSMLPIAFYCDPVGLGWRAVALAVLMGGLSKTTGDASLEEFARGFVMPMTLGVLLWV
jgi:hypothetical protein